MKNGTLILLIILSTFLSQAQQEEERYIPETDSLVIQKLTAWQGLKFGLLMHWGPYSQWGIVESWSICPEDYGWCERKKGTHFDHYYSYVKSYENLLTTFNPKEFDPERWAGAAQKAGMKYVIFTTKHHDGFCMFDTKYTDYKITGSECPFSANPRANVTREIFTAFREKGLWTGAYFSKPDWHHPAYWWPYFPPFDRNVNYDPALYPEKWEEFVQFTHNQIMELMTGYGKIDILWLDGGWVAPQPQEEIDKKYNALQKETPTGFIKKRVVSQDIRMDELVSKARKKQPGLLVVDRAVYGKNQNYLTPENRVPETTLPYPWESCIIAGGGWSYAFNAAYMTSREVIHLLIAIVAKGGNLLLNIAPSPAGTWDEEAYKMLEGVGEWMQVNNQCVYNTFPLEPFKEKNICLTQNKDNVFLICLLQEGESLPGELNLSAFLPAQEAKISMPGFDTRIQWKIKEKKLHIYIPEGIQKISRNQPAMVFQITKLRP
ncbi:MAG TPA: alpha-L-fucosidase [Bacteroidales bacterium]|nr:alpha-L-fucosidase [Bacteroidales bacterium]